MAYKDEEKRRAYQRAWRKANPEKVKAIQERSKAKNPYAVAEASRLYRERHPERIAAARSKEDPVKRKEYTRRYREGHREKVLEKGRKSAGKYRLAAYGLTEDSYQHLLEQQQGLCAICGKAETAMRAGKVIRLAVDHCHASGKIRGLLCRDCNTALGSFRESTTLLEAAVAYLELTDRSDADE